MCRATAPCGRVAAADYEAADEADLDRRTHGLEVAKAKDYYTFFKLADPRMFADTLHEDETMAVMLHEHSVRVVPGGGQ